MRLIALALLCGIAFAESRSEKEAKAQATALNETLSKRTHERDELARTVADLSSKLAAANREKQQVAADLSARIDALNTERDGLKTQVHGVSEIAKFQSRIVASANHASPVEVRGDSKALPAMERRIEVHQQANSEALDRNAQLTQEAKDKIEVAVRVAQKALKATESDGKTISAVLVLVSQVKLLAWLMFGVCSITAIALLLLVAKP